MLLLKSVTLLLFPEQVRDYTSCKPGGWYAELLGALLATYLQSDVSSPNPLLIQRPVWCKVP